jgi:hypothetical protein
MNDVPSMVFVARDKYIRGAIQVKMDVDNFNVVQITAYGIDECRMANDSTSFPIVLIS